MPISEETNSFRQLNTWETFKKYIYEEFPELQMDDEAWLLDSYTNSPVSTLFEVRTYPWVKENVCLIGDAAHSTYPFYGQGLNAGLYDIYILNRLITKS